MPKLNHSPGGWTYHTLDDSQIVISDGPFLIANLCEPVHGDLMANAKLIAAAPQLYESLLATLDHLRGVPMHAFSAEAAANLRKAMALVEKLEAA